jgi:hypothetical protein
MDPAVVSRHRLSPQDGSRWHKCQTPSPTWFLCLRGRLLEPWHLLMCILFKFQEEDPELGCLGDR